MSYEIMIAVAVIALCLALKEIVTRIFHNDDGAGCKCECFSHPLILFTVIDYNPSVFFMSNALA